MCWFSMARVFMFVFNFALFAAGGATLGVGIWIFTSNDTTQVIGIDIAQNGSIVLMAAGGAALLMGFLGCCGAKNESTGLLGLYFFLLLVVVIAEIAVGIWAAVNFDSVNGIVTEGFSTIDLTDPNGIDSMNNIGKEFQCCGYNESVVDFCGELQTRTELDCSCTGTTNTCTNICAASVGFSSTKIYTQSCPEAVTSYIDENMRVIAGIGIAIGIAEILGLLFSWCMCQSIKEHKGYA